MDMEEFFSRDDHYDYMALRRGSAEISCLVIDGAFMIDSVHLIIYDEEDKELLSFISEDEIAGYYSTLNPIDSIFDDVVEAIDAARKQGWL